MLFDAYLVVDWSAHSKPKLGKDSIWIGYHENATTLENLPTRFAARALVAQLLSDAVSRSRRVLVGFDFPYAYPAGFARALGLSGEPWCAVWQELVRLVDDQPNNANNRWSVAAALNARLSEGVGPFWCVPAARACTSLAVTKHAFPCGGLQEYRLVDRQLRASGRRAHSAWKLFTTGSVGSQALLGIPVLSSLRYEPELAEVSRVWPFETGSTVTPSPGRGPFVLHAEIWPGAFPIDRGLHKVLDAAQVKGLAERFAREDAAGELGRRFDINADNVVMREEGWVLGA
jgi:precorrin-8X/cobalt-precorrin-8 methylmutase